MTRMLGALKLVRPWQWLALLVVFAGGAGATYGAYQLVAGADGEDLAQDQQLIPVQRDDLVTSISINGSLVFPNTETAAFETQGALGELMAAEGQIVAAGQPLARLDDDTVASLEEALAKARVDVSAAEESLVDAMTPHTPLELDQADAKVTNANEAVRVAEEKLLDLLETTDHQLATAESAVADAVLKISTIEDDIASLTSHDQKEVDDLMFQIQTAQVVLENARRDQSLTEQEWADKIDAATEDVEAAVEDYRVPFERWLGILPAAVDGAMSPEELLARWSADLEALFDRSEVGLSPPSPPLIDDPATAWNEHTVYAFAHLSPYDIRAECEEPPAEANVFCIADEMSDAWERVVDARSALEDLETPAATAISKAEDAVARAEESLSDAQDRLSDLLEPPDALALDSKEKELAAARTALTEAEADLAALLERQAWAQVLGLDGLRPGSGEGIDTTMLTEDMSESLRTDLVAAQVNVDDAVLALRQAEEARESIAEPPDPLLVALREAELATARAAAETAEERLEGVTLTSPIDGVVTDVAVEVGDAVSRSTVVATVVDPSVIEMHGAVDEIDVLYVQAGALANVIMDALPGQVLTGVVSYVATEAVSQQGVVTYEVGIRIEAPPGVELRSGLTAVAELVLRSEPDVLLVPLQALRGSFTQPTVLVSEDGVLRERAVTTGSSDDFWVVVEGGLSEGELIVMEGVGGSSEFGFAGFRAFGGPGLRPLGAGRGGP